VVNSVIVKGVFSRRIERTESLDEAMKKTIDLAKVDALERAFGRVVFQGNSTFIENLETGSKVESKVAFASLGGSFVGGEWIQDIRIDTLIVNGDTPEDRYLKIVVEGRARKLPERQVNFNAFTAFGPESKDRASLFNDGQQFYLQLIASEKGHVVVYLDDPQLDITSKLFPSGDSGSYEIRQNATEVFPRPNEPRIEMHLSKDREFESYKLFVLFSSDVLEQPVLKNFNNDKQYLDPLFKEKGYLLPMSLQSELFQRWLQQYRLRNKGVQLQTLVCSLRKQ
jgi:hypothetical protein